MMENYSKLFNTTLGFNKTTTALLLLLVLTPFFNVWGQTTIISPTGNGGFETGATFALNGWTATTGSSNPLNHWVCGSGATTGYSGSRCAFITKMVQIINITIITRELLIYTEI